MYLNSEGFDIVCSVGAAREVGQIELNLIPAIIESHRHGADEWFHSRCTLIVASTESPSYILVVQHLCTYLKLMN